VIIHGTEGYKIADILAKENVPVICGPVICDRCKPEMKGLDLKNTAVLSENGVKTAICTDHTVIPIQYLPLSALASVKGGLDYNKALESITINAAEILDIDEIVGSLCVGKDADLQIYKKGVNPLELMSEPSFVMINGEMVKHENL
ncbi:MAG: amidohydrolase family protein, partial [Ruminococcus sp.]|nr:amidohydrolase family protein [Ruminococcus sp.]